ncbi:hypothetical protein PPERSA_05155 [Pseudocohnilembus persalinus]|uniref:Cyclic nucleotide-binding protein n=1 Tax=Pseudocohnilembus persalinus TaxID=266149 RepID=A0A0V0R975_PSEPJ|nr:hypothetical protein PPERSA_05155 [Pseudocohnilembus persalinus]|eukprot:KRX11046.1 hypothetical protein PPERSA_05155 [Pseudocohnilembus persalinus]
MKALNNTQSRKYKNLTTNQYQIINDRSIITQPNKKVVKMNMLSCIQNLQQFIDNNLAKLLKCLKIRSGEHWSSLLDTIQLNARNFDSMSHNWNISFYWAIATIMLIGTQGETDAETIFAVLSLLITVGYFAKILGQVSIVMEQIEQQKKAYKQDKEILNSFFNIHSDLSPELQTELYQETGEIDSTLKILSPGDVFGLPRVRIYGIIRQKNI